MLQLAPQRLLASEDLKELWGGLVEVLPVSVRLRLEGAMLLDLLVAERLSPVIGSGLHPLLL